MRGILPGVLAAVFLLVFAGCSEPGIPSGDEVLVKSAPLVEVKSPDGATSVTQSGAAAALPASTKYGHLAGVVVDSTITPIDGAIVAIPGLDFTDETERGGSFSFTDLVAGQYFIRAGAAGYASAETVVEIKADEFARVKFVLEKLPPPTPKVVTQEFKGFSDLTSDTIVFGSQPYCNACRFEFSVQEPGLKAVVIDVMMDPYSAPPPGSNGFYYYVGPTGAGYNEYWRNGEMGNPMQLIFPEREAGNMTDPVEIRVYPSSFPAPELSKSFNIYVTSWVNAEPPKGWKFGDPVPK